MNRRILLYDTSWEAFGGGEKYLLMMAEVLSTVPHYQIELLVDTPVVTRERVEKSFNIALRNVRITTVDRGAVRARLRDADTVVVMSNYLPFGKPAPTTIYVLQIPYPQITIGTVLVDILHGLFRESVKNISRAYLLHDARSADGVLVYSRFVQRTLLDNHDITTTVLFPPIDDFALSVRKDNTILSAGRFFSGMYNDKRYDILINAFKRLCAVVPNLHLEYHIAGNCAADRQAQDYLDALKKAAHGYPVFFHVNASYQELHTLYNLATLFWHAAGFGVNEDSAPERAEHFGMTTVEAMSASCVPIVINRGGQKEIVSHGESGYLWETIDQLVDMTADLMLHPDRIIPLQRNARARFRDFDRAHFTASLLSFFHQLEQKHQ